MSSTSESAPLPERRLITQAMLVGDLRALGVQPGMTLLVHSSLKSMGFVNGGAVAVILALEEVLGSEGTLVMPTHTADQSDPANWRNPPVPEAWWQTIRDTMPAFNAAMTPSWHMGIIAETFRKQEGVLRSNHPDASFAAWGRHARFVTDAPGLAPLFGEESCVARVYDLDGSVLLIGVDHDRNTSLHLAEFRANVPKSRIQLGSPMLVDGVRQWVAFDDIDWDESDFKQLGADFARETGIPHTSKIGDADAILVRQRPLLDYAVTWLESHRAG